MNRLRIILMPFAWLYGLVMQVRNRMYDLRLKPSTSFQIPVIVVGNLTVGGTGKTPMVEYLLTHVSTTGHPAVLSRGYGRKTKGMRVADGSDTEATIGDEPAQLYMKFGDRAIVSVGEDRVVGIAHLVNQFPDLSLVMLDDALQHRRVRPAVSILLTRFNRPFYHDLVMPAGNLREFRSGAARADVVVVTKCPDFLSAEAMQLAITAIRRYSPAPVFFMGIRYSEWIPFGNEPALPGRRVVLVTGIADPTPMVSRINQNYFVTHHFDFGDHHRYRVRDLERIREVLDKEGAQAIVTTEKDRARLAGDRLRGFVSSLPWFALPMEAYFLKDGEKFDALVRDALAAHHPA